MATSQRNEAHPENIPLAEKYYRFDSGLKTMTLYLAEHFARLEVSQAQVQAITAFREKWLPLYKKYSTPLTHTRAAVGDMRTIYAEGTKLMRGLRQQIKHNARVQLTGEDQTALQIHIDRRTHKHAQHITSAPTIVEVGINHRKNIFRVRYIGNECEMYGRLPKSNRLMIRIAHVAPDAAPPADNQYGEVKSSGSATITLNPPDDVKRGARGFITVCYVNTLGQMSPWSTPLEFIIN